MNAEIHRLFAAGGIVAAGKMTAIGLEPIKAHLGPKWDKLSGLVHALFEIAIKGSMGPGDAFLKVDELSFVVMYRDLSLAEAQLKCAEVARHVCGRLFGEQGSAISIRNVVGEVDQGRFDASKTLQSAIDEALERGGTETIISIEHIKAAVAEAAANPHFELRFTQQPRTHFAASLEDLSFAYRPIWDCAFDMIITYLCQPVPLGNVAPSPNAGFCTMTGTDEDRALLDRTILSHCVTRMENSRKDGSRVQLAIPVHFSTLARPRAWAEYGETYRTIPANSLRQLVFVIFALEGVPNSRLVKELPKLSGTRHVFCALERNEPVGGRFTGTGIHAMGIEIPEVVPDEAEMAGCVKSLALDVRAQNLEPFVFGVPNTSCVLSAMAAGARYLEGPAIHAMVADPRFAVAHGLEDVYGARLRSGLSGIKRL